MALATCVNVEFQTPLVGVGKNPLPLLVVSDLALASQVLKMGPNPLSLAIFFSSLTVVGSVPHPLTETSFWLV